MKIIAHILHAVLTIAIAIVIFQYSLVSGFVFVYGAIIAKPFLMDKIDYSYMKVRFTSYEKGNTDDIYTLALQEEDEKACKESNRTYFPNIYPQTIKEQERGQLFYNGRYYQKDQHGKLQSWELGWYA